MRSGHVCLGSLKPVFALTAIVIALVVLAPAANAANDDLTWSVAIDGRRTADIDRNAPLVLRPDVSPHLVVDLANHGAQPVTVRAVRIDGRVIGLSFFSYATRIDVVLPPGQSTRREINLDLDDLGSQAVGLIPARAQLVGANREVLGQLSFPVDVRGSAMSVYALFGLAVAGITVVLLASLLLVIARRRLPVNRWRRALLFLPVGAGLGMTATFTLSSARLLAPNGSSWLSLVSGCAAIAFVLGYFLPLGLDSTAETSHSGIGAATGAFTAESSGGDMATGLGGATT